MPKNDDLDGLSPLPDEESVGRFLDELRSAADLLRLARIGHAAICLLQDGAFLTVGRHGDEDGQKEFTISFRVEGHGRTINSTRDDLLAALLAVQGQEPAKRCGRCHKTQPLTRFAKSEASKDGRWRYCKWCESKRVRSHTARKKQEVNPDLPG